MLGSRHPLLFPGKILTELRRWNLRRGTVRLGLRGGACQQRLLESGQLHSNVGRGRAVHAFGDRQHRIAPDEMMSRINRLHKELIDPTASLSQAAHERELLLDLHVMIGGVGDQ